MSLKSLKKKRISAVWIVPIITLLIGIWLWVSHVYHQGLEITLISKNANGIVAGNTVVKNRNVDIGQVSSVALGDDFESVIIKVRIERAMDPLIRNDSIFSLIQPQIGLEGISGLSTLLSGVYIELFSGEDKTELEKKTFELYDIPPFSVEMNTGITLHLESEQSSVIPVGSTVLFRGYQVGTVTAANLNVNKREMEYQINIEKPYDILVTSNVRFWKEGSIDFSFSASGASISIPPLSALVAGGVSFDVPENTPLGTSVQNGQIFKLYDSKEDIQNSQYTEFHPFLLFFNESIEGLAAGSPVIYRGIQLGVVDKAPYFNRDILKVMSVLNYEIPVLIRIEPQRISNEIGERFDISSLLIKEQQNGLRASLKNSNLISNALYVDLDFYPEKMGELKYDKQYGFDTIATVSSGLAQIQSKVNQVLTKINELPIAETLTQMNAVLAESTVMMKNIEKTLAGLGEGSPLYSQFQTDAQKLEQVINEVKKLLNTLNEKSNALIIPVKSQPDVVPKARGK